MMMKKTIMMMCMMTLMLMLMLMRLNIIIIVVNLVPVMDIVNVIHINNNIIMLSADLRITTSASAWTT